MILNRGGLCIDSPKQLQNKKAAIKTKTNDDKCFQYALTVALNYNNIKKDPHNIKSISKIKPFIDQQDWKETGFPAQKKDWKKFELKNKTIALNILFVPSNTEKLRLAYNSKYNLIRKNQVMLLMITNGKK